MREHVVIGVTSPGFDSLHCIQLVVQFKIIWGGAHLTVMGYTPTVVLVAMFMVEFRVVAVDLDVVDVCGGHGHSQGGGGRKKEGVSSNVNINMLQVQPCHVVSEFQQTWNNVFFFYHPVQQTHRVSFLVH